MEQSKSLVQIPDRFKPHLEAITAGDKTAAVVLIEHETRLSKAIDAAEILLSKAMDGMSPELDQEINDYLVKARKTSEYFKDNRAPFTKFLKEILEVFREYERPLEKGNSDGYYDKLQKIRDDYAKALAEQARKKEAEDRKKRLHDEELARIREQCRTLFSQFVSDQIQTAKRSINQMLEDARLDNVVETSIDGLEARIDAFPGEINKDAVAKYTFPQVQRSYVEEATFKNLRTGIKNSMLGQAEEDYKRQVAEYKLLTIGRIPAKRQELEELAKAKSDADKARLEQEAADRKKAEDERLAAEKQAADDAAAVQAADAKSAEVLDQGFKAAAGSDAAPASTAQKIEEYEIEVLAAPGWSLIFAFWAKSEDAAKTTLDKYPGKTLRYMKKYAERIAKKTGEKIDSEYLRYIPKIKTVAKA